jgi:hypothetical protein
MNSSFLIRGIEKKSYNMPENKSERNVKSGKMRKLLPANQEVVGQRLPQNKLALTLAAFAFTGIAIGLFLGCPGMNIGEKDQA